MAGARICADEDSEADRANHQAVCEVCSINHKEPLAKVFPCLRVSHLSFFYPKQLSIIPSTLSFPTGANETK